MSYLFPYPKVKYQEVYPGVDVLYYSNPRQLEYDIIVAPDADPSIITLAIALDESAGTDRALPLRLDAAGEVVIQTAGGEVRLHQPVVYQEIAGVQHVIPCQYMLVPGLQGEGQGERQAAGTHQLRMQVASYDRSQPLIIDPMLSYSTYLGGNVHGQSHTQRYEPVERHRELGGLWQSRVSAVELQGPWPARTRPGHWDMRAGRFPSGP